MVASDPGVKSNPGKLVFASAGLAVACVLLMWQSGVFSGGAPGTDPNIPPAVVETPAQREAREAVEELINRTTDEVEAPIGSS